MRDAADVNEDEEIVVAEVRADADVLKSMSRHQSSEQAKVGS